MIEVLSQAGYFLEQAVYRTNNWKEYNQALINRGSLTFWIDEEAINSSICSEHHGNRGCSNLNLDTAITAALMVKRLFNLSFRAVQGFMD